MAFFHDIHVIKNEDGTTSVIESEYSMDDCIKRGWFDLENCQWIRKEVAAPDSFPDLYKHKAEPDRLYKVVFDWMKNKLTSE